MRRIVLSVAALFALWMLTGHDTLLAQRTGYSKEEFARRRQAIMQQTGGGLIVLFGNDRRDPATHFRQDNDFYYFTGPQAAQPQPTPAQPVKK